MKMRSWIRTVREVMLGNSQMNPSLTRTADVRVPAVNSAMYLSSLIDHESFIGMHDKYDCSFVSLFVQC